MSRIAIPSPATRDQVLMVGLSHHTAPIELRERFYVEADRVAPWIRTLEAASNVSECVVLSTCNRSECYVVGPTVGTLEADTRTALVRLSGLDPSAEVHLESTHGIDAVRHLFRVVSGLDSLIIGEPQIQGQVGAAYRASGDGGVGPVLHRLFQSALAAGGRVRETTAIGEGATSIPSAAVNLARKVFGTLEDRTVLVIGTGEMGQLTVESLRSQGAQRVYVASRNPARAERVGGRLQAAPLTRAGALERLDEMDLVVACTESEAAFVERQHVETSRAESPLVFLDIAVPRNVSTAVADQAGVFLYNVDDLQRVVDRAREAREFERERAEAVIERHAAKYWTWYRRRLASPAIRSLRNRSRAIVAEAIEAGRVPGPQDADAEEAARVATRAALNKILHGPTRAIQWLAERSDAELCLNSLEPWLLDRPDEDSTRGIVERGLG